MEQTEKTRFYQKLISGKIVKDEEGKFINETVMISGARILVNYYNLYWKQVCPGEVYFVDGEKTTMKEVEL